MMAWLLRLGLIVGLYALAWLDMQTPGSVLEALPRVEITDATHPID
ncbi:hypothetical protein [Halomicronema sp. CCY15110]|nr:hypothetical protein [Halomicronema sp. CCY15110]